MILADNKTDIVEIADITDIVGKEPADILALVSAPDIAVSRVILKAVKALLDKERRALETRPEENNVDIIRDWRVRIGMINMAKIVLSLPTAAQGMIDAVEEQ